MNNKLFGTDGVRGRANLYPITPEIALLLGKAIAHVFQASGRGEKKAVVGKDTRLSCYMLEAALIGGLLSKAWTPWPSARCLPPPWHTLPNPSMPPAES
jgi:phosphoglucosamine mutase